MLNYQLHIARIFCFITAFLISGGTVVNALEIDKRLFLENKADVSSKDKVTIQWKDPSDSSDTVFSLTKDPSEGDADFFDLAFQEFTPFYFYLSPKLTDKKHFFYYNPFIKERPIWIKNQQIRI